MDELIKTTNFLNQNDWVQLKQYTSARIALGRVGVNIPLEESLKFKMAHAHARDAVYARLNKVELISMLEQSGYSVALVHSRATSREEYLQRPDLGRKLNDESVGQLHTMQPKGYDVVFILADGLSACAINKHAIPVLSRITRRLQTERVSVAPIILAEQGRVALSDEIGVIVQASLAVILIGERPGLSSPDSLGAYLTYHPTPGTSDQRRNCVSNIRPEGLDYDHASEKITWLIMESLKRKISGIALKDHFVGASFLTPNE